jgi:hypothetical protein
VGRCNVGALSCFNSADERFPGQRFASGKERATAKLVKRSPAYLGPSQPQDSPRGVYWLGNLLIAARQPSRTSWRLDWVSAMDSRGRTIWLVDAQRGDGKRFVVRADEKLTAFVELERAIHGFAVSLIA